MPFNKIIISQQNAIHLIDYKDIIYCQSDNCYTFINTADGKKIIVVKSLSRLMKEGLAHADFIRVGQSYVINRNFITSIDKKSKNIILENSQAVPFTIAVKQLLFLLNNQDDPNQIL